MNDFPLNDWLPYQDMKLEHWGPWLKHDGGPRPDHVRHDINPNNISDVVVYVKKHGYGIGRNHSPDWDEIIAYRLTRSHPHYFTLFRGAILKE